MMRTRHNITFPQRNEHQSPHSQRGSKRDLKPKQRPFRCLEQNCGKSYSQQNGIYKHLQVKHQSNYKQALQRYNAVYGKAQQEKEKALRHGDIPTVQEEFRHRNNTDTAFNRICDEWPKGPRISSIQEVLFDNADPSLEDSNVDEKANIAEIRKNLLNRAIQDLVKKYDMGFLVSMYANMPEFQDYSVPRSRVLNFAWGLIINFKPGFAAKLWLVILSLCADPEDLERNYSWQRFLERVWSPYRFIDEILKEYRQKWLELARNINFY